MSADNVELQVNIKLTPEQVAHAWWNLASDEQAEFYAHLNRIAGYKLCMQTAWIVDAIVNTEDHEAQSAFGTIHAHAAEFLMTAVDIRTSSALRGIEIMASEARKTHA